MSFFGYKYVLGNIITSLLFTLTWTVGASLIRNDDKFGSDRGYVSVAFTVLGAGLTVFGFIKVSRAVLTALGFIKVSHDRYRGVKKIASPFPCCPVIVNLCERKPR